MQQKAMSHLVDMIRIDASAKTPAREPYERCAMKFKSVTMWRELAAAGSGQKIRLRLIV